MFKATKRLTFSTLCLLASFAHAAPHQGLVKDTVDAAGYTYMQIEEAGQTYWIAGPPSAIGVGASVRFDEQIWMNNFHSKALDRTFERILFVAGVQEAKAEQVVADTGAVDLLTVEEVFARREALKGQVIAVRGRVAKVSTNIMNRTWVHIQDGTGGEGSNDLIFRSSADSATVGSTVVASGTVDIDRDFGMGYQYPVLIEDAVFNP